MVFNEKLDAWKITSSNGASIQDFNSHLEVSGLTIMVQGKPKDGDKFSLEVTSSNASNMKVLISDASKLAAAGLHTIEADIKNLGSSELKIGYFNETKVSDAANLQGLFSETRNAANPIRFNSSGALGVIEDVESLKRFVNFKISI